MTVNEIAGKLAGVVGEIVGVKHLGDEGVVGERHVFAHEKVSEKMGEDIGVTSDKWGIGMNSFDDFIARNIVALEDELKAKAL